jgi:acetyltransferase-like isoleucine patch superfamily enzyme
VVSHGVEIIVVDGGSLSIGDDTIFENHCHIKAGGTITIGNNSFFGARSEVVCLASISIGPDALVASDVTIRDHDHGTEREGEPYRLQPHRTSPIVIGRNVWLGAKATILKGVEIGDDAVVGANSVVTKSVPAGATVAGAPARRIAGRTSSSRAPVAR